MPSCDWNNNDCDGCNSCRTDEEKQRIRDEIFIEKNDKVGDVIIDKDGDEIFMEKRSNNGIYTVKNRFNKKKEIVDDVIGDVGDEDEDGIRFCTLHGFTTYCDCFDKQDKDKQEKEIFFEFKLKIPKAEKIDKIKNICSEIENKKNELNELIKEYKKLLKTL
jgi:hypothetical protein